jgi:hypothetical protein
MDVLATFGVRHSSDTGCYISHHVDVRGVRPSVRPSVSVLAVLQDPGDSTKVGFTAAKSCGRLEVEAAM